MGGAWITDICHFLDDAGRVAPGLPAVPRYICAVTSAASLAPRGEITRLGVRCRRRPGRKPCPGSVHASVGPSSGEISWFCPCCGDHGLIYNWQGTVLDQRTGMPSEPAAADNEPAGFSAAAARSWQRIPPTIRVRLLNSFWCPVCLEETSVDLRSGVVLECDLILRGHCTRCGGEIARMVEEVAGR